MQGQVYDHHAQIEIRRHFAVFIAGRVRQREGGDRGNVWRLTRRPHDAPVKNPGTATAMALLGGPDRGAFLRDRRLMESGACRRTRRFADRLRNKLQVVVGGRLPCLYYIEQRFGDGPRTPLRAMLRHISSSGFIANLVVAADRLHPILCWCHLARKNM